MKHLPYIEGTTYLTVTIYDAINKGDVWNDCDVIAIEKIDADNFRFMIAIDNEVQDGWFDSSNLGLNDQNEISNLLANHEEEKVTKTL